MKIKICNLIIFMNLFKKIFKGKKMKIDDEDLNW